MSREIDSVWYLQLLGTITAESEGETLELAPRKYTSLLAFMALSPGRPFTREELIDRFWPDSDIDRGRGALRTALSALRRQFGADLLAESGDTVRLRAERLTTDVARFEAMLREASAAADVAREQEKLQEALALYLGPLLPALYGDWVLKERERLEERFREARERERQIALAAERAARFQPPSAKTDGPELVSLPRFASRFLGRAAEQQTLQRMLLSPDIRLVTLTGAGGMGKTRLALETAHRIASRFAGAVCFVPLVDSRDADSLAHALARSLRLNLMPGSDPGSEALRRLSVMGPSLMLLDNLEHLLEAGAPEWVADLLAQQPDLTILATSRAPLGIDGEQEFPLLPLPPDDAVSLFRQHAAAVQPDFAEWGEAINAGEETAGPAGKERCEAGTEEERAQLLSLCERLEGIPLAIELCAPWVRVLSLVEIRERLQDRFALLTTRRRDLPERHRSLHAALEWGCPTEPGLLAFFLNLSLFVGGFDREAAEAVAGPEALTRIADLCERSLLLTIRDGDGGTRYRMLETVREFAREKITPEERQQAARRHLRYFEERARQETGRLAGSDAGYWFERLDREVTNFREAIDFGLGDTSESLALACGLIERLDWFWRVRGHRMPVTEWRDILFHRREGLPGASRAWATLCYASRLPDGAKREALLQESSALYRAAGDPGGVALTLEIAASDRIARDDWERGRALYDEAIALRESVGDRRGMGYAFAELAGRYVRAGRIAEARPLWKRSREIAVELDDIGSVAVLDRAEGRALFGEGQVQAATELLRGALAAFRTRGDTWQIMDTLTRLSEMREAAGDLPESLSLCDEALALAVQIGDAGTRDFLQKRRADLLLTQNR